MPTPTKGARLGGSPSHERLILGNLATALFEHGSITTTQAKAKRLRPLAETLITKAKRGDLHARRQVMRTIQDKSVVHALFTEIAERFETRPGGYTRITKLGPRKGDNAPMVVIELVEAVTAKKAAPAKKAAKAPAKKAAAADASDSSSEAPESTEASQTTEAEKPGESEDTAATQTASAEEAAAEAIASDEGAEAAGGESDENDENDSEDDAKA